MDADLLDAERRLQAAQLASDVEALDRLLHDECRYVGPDGSSLTKTDDLTAHASGAQRLTRLDELELQALVVGTTGVTFFRGAVAGTAGGAAFAADVRYTRCWARDDALGWQVVAAHASLV